MITIISIVTILAAIVLILVVLVQNSKGGGLSSNFSSSNQIMGAPKTADFLEKTTWALAGTIIVLSLISGRLIRTPDTGDAVNVTTPIDNTQAPDMQSPQPTLPMPQPTETPQETPAE